MTDHPIEDPDDLELLLPWAASGRLTPEEEHRIEAAVARDPELARRLALASEERSETVSLNEELGVPSGAAQSALFIRIDATRRPPPALGATMDRLAGWLSSLTPRNLAIVTLAATTLVLLQMGVISAWLIDAGRHPGPFVTASAPGTNKKSGPHLLIRFNPSASAQAISALLHDEHAEIVGGPRPGDLYEITIAEGALKTAGVEALIARLQSNSRIVNFAVNENISDD